MRALEQPQTVSRVAAILAGINGVLFALGAMLHIGVNIAPFEEPVSPAAMMAEAVSAIVLGLATMGVFTEALWARRLAVFANVLALLAIAIVGTALALHRDASTTSYHVLQVLRALLSVVTLFVLWRSPVHAVTRP